MPHSHQFPVVVCPAYAITETGVVAAGLSDEDSENQSGRVSMHTAANSSFVLKDRSSFKRFTDLETAISHAGFYQQFAQGLVKGVQKEQDFGILADKLAVVAEKPTPCAKWKRLND